MKNPYAVGFYCALVALLVLSTGVFFGNLSVGGADKAFSFIGSFSSLVQAIAAIVVGGIAFHGLSAWRNQIIYGKALGVIWDAQVALRQIEASGGVYLQRIDALDRGRKTKKEITEEIDGTALGDAFSKFKYQCILLDKVVVKRGAEWQDHASDLERSIHNLAIEISKPLPSSTWNLANIGKRSDAEVEKHLSDADGYIERMSSLLDSLAEKYMV
ncbi:hypothetical protein [Pseudomonas sp. NFACC25]|uniref:hypothetical protein n=1 Tax=Pseudomonas sp. NFACC25 TaxID=1566188 RepID=UPI0011140081|nr:hypothetical protein [Pseudomonas sp. NFACC25]